jgi:hypothetical protein
VVDGDRPVEALRAMEARPNPPAPPGSKFPISGVGTIDNGTVWFRGLFAALGSALAASGPTGRSIVPFRCNQDDDVDGTVVVLCTAIDTHPH